MFQREKVITVSDSRQKEMIQEAFVQHKIEYKIKIKEIMQKNAIDTARLGSLGNNKVKFQYSFYVDREDRQLADDIVKSIRFSLSS
ncbi:MAG: hypothetical protein K2P66_01465 [Lachnospiraceae bacterium]|nr:hypothetical protein [Lachnospiraceae bacterium]